MQIDQIQEYVRRGTPPGGFLTAVLSNDLRGAAMMADDQNRHLLYEYVKYLHNNVPALCWGSPERVQEWIERGGLSSRFSDACFSPVVER